MARDTIEGRIDGLDWSAIGRELAERGYARIPRLLLPLECRALFAL